MRLLSEPLNSLRKANTPPPPSFPATSKDVPFGHTATAIYKGNKEGLGVAVPGPAPFEAKGKATGARVPVCTLP